MAAALRRPFRSRGRAEVLGAAWAEAGPRRQRRRTTRRGGRARRCLLLVAGGAGTLRLAALGGGGACRGRAAAPLPLGATPHAIAALPASRTLAVLCCVPAAHACDDAPRTGQPGGAGDRGSMECEGASGGDSDGGGAAPDAARHELRCIDPATGAHRRRGCPVRGAAAGCGCGSWLPGARAVVRVMRALCAREAQWRPAGREPAAARGVQATPSPHARCCPARPACAWPACACARARPTPAARSSSACSTRSRRCARLAPPWSPTPTPPTRPPRPASAHAVMPRRRPRSRPWPRCARPRARCASATAPWSRTPRAARAWPARPARPAPRWCTARA